MKKSNLIKVSFAVLALAIAGILVAMQFLGSKEAPITKEPPKEVSEETKGGARTPGGGSGAKGK